MKQITFIILGMIVAGGICIGLAWLLGALWGPLYQGEDESTRNFKIFLATFVVFVVAGGIGSNTIYKKKNLN